MMHSDLLRLARSCRSAIGAACVLLERYVSDDRGELARRDVRRATARAERRARLALYCARACATECPDVFAGVVAALVRVGLALPCASEATEIRRYRRSARRASVCAGIAITLLAVEDAEREACEAVKMAQRRRAIEPRMGLDS